MVEFDVNAKDYIKLNFLSEVISNSTIDFFVYLEIDEVEKNYKDIRTDKSVYRFNNFNVSEDTTQNVITFRPVVVGCYSYFKIITNNPVRIDIVKNGTTTVAKEFNIPIGETKIEFEPQGIQRYIMRLNEAVAGIVSNVATPNVAVQSIAEEVAQPAVDPLMNPFGDFGGFGGFESVSDIQPSSDIDVNDERKVENGSFETSFTTNEIRPESSAPTNQGLSNETKKDYEKRISQLEISNSRLEADVRDLEANIHELKNKNATLVLNKKNLIKHMNKLQAEYDKDYQSYEDDIEEIKSKYTIDDEILKMYAGKDVVSIEELLQKAETDILQIEEQVRIFVEAQQRKTVEIENELKIGKKE